MLYNLNEEYIAKCFKLKNIQTDQWKQSKFWGITINDLFSVAVTNGVVLSGTATQGNDFCCWL